MKKSNWKRILVVGVLIILVALATDVNYASDINDLMSDLPTYNQSGNNGTGDVPYLDDGSGGNQGGSQGGNQSSQNQSVQNRNSANRNSAYGDDYADDGNGSGNGSNSAGGSNVANRNNTNSANRNNNTNNSNRNGNTNGNTQLPKTGVDDTATLAFIVISVAVAIYTYKKVREYNS